MRFFTIPASAGDAATDELNRFLSSHRILSVDRQFVADGAASFWAVCVTCLPPKGPDQSAKRTKVDYRDVLGPDDFALFARLRTLRKAIAEREGIPAYAIFTNEQLAELVEKRVSSLAAMATVAGIGSGRIDKYGDVFLQAIAGQGDGEPPMSEPQTIET